MRQLVGQNCVRCGERIPSELDGSFCAECGCPSHHACRTSPALDGGCWSCGASPADRAAHAPEAQKDAGERAKRDRTPGAGAVWFATERRLRRGLKTSWFDDRGAVEAVPGGVRFVGADGAVVMRDVRSVEVVGPVVPWMTIGGLAVGTAVTLALASAGAFKVLTLDNPWTYALLGVLNLLCLGSCPMRWVRVEYGGEQAERAYFTPAPSLSRWTGGTDRLAEQIRELASRHTRGVTEA